MRTILTLTMLVVLCQAQSQRPTRQQDAPPPSRWFHLDTTQDDTKVLVERAMKTLPNGNKTRWVRYVKSDDSATMHLMEFNCKLNKSRTIQYASYDSKGSVIFTDNIVTSWASPIPDTIGESLVDGACLIWNVSPEDFLAGKGKAKAKKKK